jgi:indolepyruvate ferredoxin oxidoreductase alpha subunit
MTSKIALDKPSSFVLLNGDEAVARGAIEAGIKLAAAYPGTPSTEILEAIAEVAAHFDIYAEWSVNEIVATEVAAGAAMTGVRAVVSMKHVGLNVAADAAMTLAYTGVEGGMVIAVCTVARTSRINGFFLFTRTCLCWTRATRKKPRT